MLSFFTLNSDSPKKFPKAKAFTLIELLVVISIIGLLLSIIVPSLGMAKKKAATAVCLANVKQLSLAWYMYQEENDGKVVPPTTSTDPLRPKAWVAVPIKENDTPCGETDQLVETTDEDEKRGIELGLLYPYVEAFDVYHCPADNQRKSKYDNSKIFRTYSLPKALTGKFINFSSPAYRFTFVEESEGRNFNVGTWDFYTPYNSPYDYEWRDPIGVNHGDSGIIGFCDGHAEVHKWQDTHTKARVEYYFNDPKVVNYGFGDATCLNNAFPRDKFIESVDIPYIAKGWIPKR